MSRYKKDDYWIAAGILVMAILFAYILIQTNSTHPSPTHKPSHITHQWSKADSLAYAHDQIIKDAQAQFSCLSNLWGKESAWEPKAHNSIEVMGKTAGGIPQLLGMSPLTPPTQQIERGLAYIHFRYVSPCKAWQHWQRLGWY